MIARIYTILNTKSGEYWQSINDMNSTKEWGTAFTFWFDKTLAEECLKYHKKDDEYMEYKYCEVVELEIGNLLFTNFKKE